MTRKTETPLLEDAHKVPSSLGSGKKSGDCIAAPGPDPPADLGGSLGKQEAAVAHCVGKDTGGKVLGSIHWCELS